MKWHFHQTDICYSIRRPTWSISSFKNRLEPICILQIKHLKRKWHLIQIVAFLHLILISRKKIDSPFLSQFLSSKCLGYIYHWNRHQGEPNLMSSGEYKTISQNIHQSSLAWTDISHQWYDQKISQHWVHLTPSGVWETFNNNNSSWVVCTSKL